MCDTNPAETVGFRSKYGADETNGLVDGAAYHASVDYSRTLSLKEVSDAGGKITRVRLLTERVMGRTLCDVSYIHATLPDGTTVNVQNGLNNLTPYRTLKAEMIAWAKREGVFAKGIDLLNEGNWSTL
jgi:hypothetical protein